MLKEFREFIDRGNVVDLAIAVILGAAFNEIVNALVTGIITPIIGIFLGGINVDDMVFTTLGVDFAYGLLLQAIIDFLIIALVLFFIVRAINRFQREEGTPDEVVAPEEVRLLRDIRDLMVRQQRRAEQR